MIRPSVGLLGVALLWGWLVAMRLLPFRFGKLAILGLGSVLLAASVSWLVPHHGGVMTQAKTAFVPIALASCVCHLLVLALIRARKPHTDFDRNR